MNMGEVMEQIPKVELTGLDDICKISNMSGLQCYCQKNMGERTGLVGGGKNQEDRSHFGT